MERMAMQQRAQELGEGKDPLWRGVCSECLEPIRRRQAIDYIMAEVERGEQTNPYICECVNRFQEALNDDRHHRCLNQNHLRKEVTESMAVLKAVEGMLMQLVQQGGREVDTKKLILVDCCCGTGLTSVLLSAAFPDASVVGVDILSPRSLTHFSSPKATIRRADLFTADGMLEELLMEEGSALVLIGMHLCGLLSTKCLELFKSLGERCLGVVLAPCCLPKQKKTDPDNLVARAQRLGIERYSYWCSELVLKARAVGDVVVELKHDTHILSPKCSIITAHRNRNTAHEACEGAPSAADEDDKSAADGQQDSADDICSADAICSADDICSDDICWVCCEGESHSPLLFTGCGCRGSSGLAHISCLVQAATHNVDRWTSCPTCTQDFTGECEIGLARARWEGVRDRPPEDEERLFVANNLAVTLQQAASDSEGAFKLLEEVLEVRRRKLGDEHPDTLDSITNLALHHSEMGNYEAALPLSEEAVAATRRTVGNTHEEAGHAIISLATVHSLMGNYTLARPLHEEALEMRRGLIGAEHLDTMNSMHGLGHCLVNLGECEEGNRLLEETVAIARRMLGEHHPSTEHFERGLARPGFHARER
jgi:tetratricopeptide (TPR) repeat protein